jgi:hypothetical protein
LLIGVSDDGTPCGLEPDYETLRKPGKADSDAVPLEDPAPLLLRIVKQAS